MKQFSFVVITILYASTAYGLDLAGMQDMALKNRKIIQRYVTALEQSEKDILLAKGGYYPSVDIFYTVNSLDEQSTIESRVVGTCRKSMPRRKLAAANPPRSPTTPPPMATRRARRSSRFSARKSSTCP